MYETAVDSLQPISRRRIGSFIKVTAFVIWLGFLIYGIHTIVTKGFGLDPVWFWAAVAVIVWLGSLLLQRRKAKR